MLELRAYQERSLEALDSYLRLCTEHGIAFHPFDVFDELTAALDAR